MDARNCNVKEHDLFYARIITKGESFKWFLSIFTLEHLFKLIRQLLGQELA